MAGRSTAIYVHEEDVHGPVAPAEIVPMIHRALQPKSVVDVGCGVGNFLAVFKSLGVEDVFGVDGPWVDRTMLTRYIREDEFLATDLTQELDLGRTFDLAMSLEVAEHLAPETADRFVASLVRLSPVVIFSAAIPFQGGQNHLNERRPEYWIEKFAAHGYTAHDVLRPVIWHNEQVPWWYRQNMLLFTAESHRDAAKAFGEGAEQIPHLVHPENFEEMAERLQRTLSGNLPLRSYVSMLVKSLLRIASGQRAG